jgi:hypothetical protein
MLRRVALVITDVSEEPSASFIRMTRIGELGTTLAATSNRRTLRRSTKWERKLEWNSELWIPLGYGEGRIVAWFVNGPRQSEVTSYGRRVGGIVLSKLWMGNCVAECPWVISRKYDAASVVPSSMILVTLMKEGPGSLETSLLTRATRRNIPQDDILHSHRRENLKPYNRIPFLQPTGRWYNDWTITYPEEWCLLGCYAVWLL